MKEVVSETVLREAPDGSWWLINPDKTMVLSNELGEIAGEEVPWPSSVEAVFSTVEEDAIEQQRITAALEVQQNISDMRSDLVNARNLLLAYGSPSGQAFTTIYPQLQVAVLAYRDSGIVDEVCEDHIMWINTRVNEINAAALHALGALQ